MKRKIDQNSIKGILMEGSVNKDHKEIMCNMRNGLMKSMGYTDKDLKRPLVAIVHAWSEMSPGEFHMKLVAKYAKSGVREAGGTPAELIIPGECGGIDGAAGDAHKFNVPYRDIVASLVEIMLHMGLFDAAVFLAGCDHVIPAFLMGACLTNLPSIMVTGGYMEPGENYKGHALHATSAMKMYGKYKKGEISEKDLKKIVDNSCPGPGACTEMATAHTMATISEALGMSLPGNTAVAAISNDLLQMAKKAGQQVMELYKENITPKDIITRDSCENAMRTVLAVGGSPNALIHLPAITREVGIELSWDQWEELSKKTPFICSVLPNNPDYTMKDLDRAGRIKGVMKEIEPLLHTDVLTVSGRTLKENLREAKVYDRQIIRTLKEPFSKDGGLVILKGNLAPEGAILKKSAYPSHMYKYKGLAKVFDQDKFAIQAIIEGKIKPGDIIVIRYEGPRGGPGGVKLTLAMHTLISYGLAEKVALLTDGAFSGTNLGAGIGYVSPEAEVGGPLAIVENNDYIEIDVENRTLNLLIDNDTFKTRLSNWTPRKTKELKGTLGLFKRNAASYSKGAYIL